MTIDHDPSQPTSPRAPLEDSSEWWSIAADAPASVPVEHVASLTAPSGATDGKEAKGQWSSPTLSSVVQGAFKPANTSELIPPVPAGAALSNGAESQSAQPQKKRRMSRKAATIATVAGVLVAGGATAGAVAAAEGSSAPQLSTAEQLKQDALKDPAAFSRVFLNAVLADDSESTAPYVSSEMAAQIGALPQAWEVNVDRTHLNFVLHPQHPVLQNPASVEALTPADKAGVTATFNGLQSTEGDIHSISLILAYEDGALKVEGITEK